MLMARADDGGHDGRQPLKANNCFSRQDHYSCNLKQPLPEAFRVLRAIFARKNSSKFFQILPKSRLRTGSGQAPDISRHYHISSSRLPTLRRYWQRTTARSRRPGSSSGQRASTAPWLTDRTPRALSSRGSSMWTAWPSRASKKMTSRTRS